MGKHEDKNLKNILEGKDVEKKIQVGGYDKEFSDKMKKEKEEERKQNEALSKILAEVRMPLFCPKCQSVMTKRLDKKFWMKGFKSCFNCVIEEEHKIRSKGPDDWKKYENRFLLYSKKPFLTQKIGKSDHFFEKKSIFFGKKLMDQ